VRQSRYSQFFAAPARSQDTYLASPNQAGAPRRCGDQENRCIALNKNPPLKVFLTR
jgi:hypothetical protein